MNTYQYATGPGGPLLLDEYLPTSSGPFPVAVCIHPGGWVSGSRIEWDTKAAHLASLGFAALAIDYTLDHVAPWPQQLTDLDNLMTWIGTRPELDSNHIVSVGGSSGGHLSQVLATMGSRPLRAAVTSSGPSDLTTIAAQVSAVYAAKVDNLVNAEFPTDALKFTGSPVKKVSSSTCPLAIYNSSAEIIPAAQAQELADACAKQGIEHTLTIVSGTAHAYYGSTIWHEQAAWLKGHV